MKLYDFIEINNDYKYLVLSTSYISPLDKLDMIKNNLIKCNFVGKVLFDLLMSNGFSINRFLEIYFDGKKFDINSVKIIDNLSEDLLNTTYDYYYHNPQYVNNSILPNSQKYILKKGLLNKV